MVLVLITDMCLVCGAYAWMSVMFALMMSAIGSCIAWAGGVAFIAVVCGVCSLSRMVGRGRGYGGRICDWVGRSGRSGRAVVRALVSRGSRRMVLGCSVFCGRWCRGWGVRSGSCVVLSVVVDGELYHDRILRVALASSAAWPPSWRIVR